MEQSGVDFKRLALFFVISVAVLMAWPYLAPRPPSPPPSPPPAPPAAAPSSPEPEAPVPQPTGPAQADDAQRDATVRMPRAIVEFTNVGGRISSWKILGAGEYGDPKLPLEMVHRDLVPGPPEAPDATVPGARPVPPSQELLPLQVVTGDDAVDARLRDALHVVSVSDDGPSHVVTLAWADGQGLSVEKRVTLHDDSPLATVEARVGVGGRPVPFHLAWGPGICNHTEAERSGKYFQRGQLIYRTAGKVKAVAQPEKADALAASAVDWAGIEDSFFVALFIPSPGGGAAPASTATGYELKGRLRPRPDGKVVARDWPDALVLAVPFTPGAPTQSLYVGPRERQVLRHLDDLLPGHDFPSVLQMGWIQPIAVVMHEALIWFHRQTGSWGIAILLLTVAIRAVMFPLTHLSLKKMKRMQDKMQVLRPKQKALEERYRKLPRSADNRQRQQQELMALYHEVGLNPADTMIGCLPLLLSMPFFWAMFSLLKQATEFRHQPFLAWHDLASADPWHVWPIVTGLTMFISSRFGSTSAAPTDPLQKNMLYVFPVMFTWICWSAPLGLVVYWTTSNVIQIAQQSLLKFTLPSPEGGTKTVSRAGADEGQRVAGRDAPRLAEGRVTTPNAAGPPARRKKGSKR